MLVTHRHPDHLGGVAELRQAWGEELRVSKLPPCDSGVRCDTLADGDVVTVEGATLRVLATPGHAADHACFFLVEERAIFTGDCVLGETTTTVESLPAYMASLRRLRALGAARLYPGHGRWLDSAAAIDDTYAHREKRIRQVFGACRSCSADAITRQLYPGVPSAVLGAARRNTEQALAVLAAEGKVECVGGLWRRRQAAL